MKQTRAVMVHIGATSPNGVVSTALYIRLVPDTPDDHACGYTPHWVLIATARKPAVKSMARHVWPVVAQDETMRLWKKANMVADAKVRKQVRA